MPDEKLVLMIESKQKKRDLEIPSLFYFLIGF
jgi:hypothetical protein